VLVHLNQEVVEEVYDDLMVMMKEGLLDLKINRILWTSDVGQQNHMLKTRSRQNLKIAVKVSFVCF